LTEFQGVVLWIENTATIKNIMPCIIDVDVVHCNRMFVILTIPFVI